MTQGMVEISETRQEILIFGLQNLHSLLKLTLALTLQANVVRVHPRVFT
jgi:hypothetical protein